MANAESTQKSVQIIVADDCAQDRELVRIASESSLLNPRYVDDRNDIWRELAEISKEGLTTSAIIVDVHMPGMSLAELIIGLRSDTETASTCVVVMTDSSAPRTREESLAAGADLFVRKPVTLDELESFLNQLGEELQRGDRPQQRLHEAHSAA